MEPVAPNDQPAAETDARPDLEQLDEALAVDVERLLHGSVEEVEEVLDGLFEETAASAIDARVVSRPARPSPALRPEVAAAPAVAPPVPVPSATRPAVDRTSVTPVPPSDGLRDVLGLINAPIHWLGPTGRRAIDWLAITLLLWVPVIWIIILAKRG